MAKPSREELYVLGRESKDGVAYSALRNWKSLQEWIADTDTGGTIYHCYLTPFARAVPKVELLSAEQEYNDVAVSDIPEPNPGDLGQVSTADTNPIPEDEESRPVRAEKKKPSPAPKRRRRKRSRKLLPSDGVSSEE